MIRLVSNKMKPDIINTIAALIARLTAGTAKKMFAI
ncbi:hypothetical protein MGSAQ_002513, partial [marine sediment metagenome]